MEEMSTKDPSEAVDLLLGSALNAAPCITENQIRDEYRSLRNAWGSQQLFGGSPAELRTTILANLEELGAMKEFEEFVVKVLDNQACAQVIAVFSTGTFTGIRVWHSETMAYACGNSAFHM